VAGVMGERIVTDKNGGRWREVDTGPHRVERTWIGGSSAIREGYNGGADAVRIIGASSPSSPRTTRPSSAPSKPKPADKPPIRRWRAADLCDVEVLLGSEALDQIRRTTLWLSGQDHLEAGGWLAGIGLDRTIAVFDATSDTVKRSAHSVTLDVKGLNQLTKLRESGGDLAPVGCYHIHPRGSSWRPSDQDYRAWEGGHEWNNLTDWQPYYLGLIVTPDERGSYANPQISAFVTRREDGRYVTEPARIRAVA
jgi:Prokaryotic homologs of the JAB domain